MPWYHHIVLWSKSNSSNMHQQWVTWYSIHPIEISFPYFSMSYKADNSLNWCPTWKGVNVYWFFGPCFYVSQSAFNSKARQGANFDWLPVWGGAGILTKWYKFGENSATWWSTSSLPSTSPQVMTMWPYYHPITSLCSPAALVTMTTRQVPERRARRGQGLSLGVFE